MKNVIISIFLLMLVASASGAELLVPTQYPTIQSAIDAALDGDTVIVAPGTYTGPCNRDIDFLGKAITIRSADPNDPNIVAATIIDCNGKGRGFYFHSAEDTNSILEGFTIIKGYGSGILCQQSSPMISKCRIINNYAAYGGGIACISSNAILSNCIVKGNYTNGCGSDGGGIYCCRGSPIISCCNIIGNWARYRSGGGIYCRESSPAIINCRVVGNFGMGGGGIASYRNSSPFITNCTITDNKGGGISGSMKITNSILWGNESQTGTEIYGSGADVTYSDVKGSWPGQGNISAYPCFVQPGHWDANGTPSNVDDDFWVDGDYHLLLTSPCINTGDPNYVAEPNETDLDGLPRIIGARIDMGAYEFNHQPVAVAEPNQVAYARIDGYADVNLDGSASFDEDNDILDYYWSWIIDGNTYEANGVNPTIELPVGEHTIELVVDDGIDFSEPDYCTITVIKSVRGRLMIAPRVLEVKSHDKWILATLLVPYVAGEQVNTNEPLCLYPGGIKAKHQRFHRYGRPSRSFTIALALFDRQQVIDALGPGKVEVSVVGRFLTGRFFFGSDTIRIITPPHRPPYYWHW